MDRDRFERVQALFREALGCRPEEVRALLDSRCGSDAELRRQVEVLLAAHREATGFLEESPAAADLSAPAGLAGRTVGAYRIVRRIGGGGMGVVYLAERADDAYRKRVAIKVLRSGGDSEAIVHRFTTERQILAALDHPNIAKLVDGGATDEGLPYIAMEYVEGKPIDEYCDARRLGIRARLELFLTLCDAVQFAHSNLVVHRDLKPSNVLITGDRQLKLLDFGIAKLLNPELSVPASQTTVSLLRMLTPDYASPEQVQGGPITTASDIYSLGVLLYELLAGRGPYRFGSRSPAEMLDAICLRAPEPPSVAVSRARGESVEAGGAASQAEDSGPVRRGDAARLRRALSGDLDAIVGKALRKTPEQRYASAALLAEDIRRHLQGLPVQARRGTTIYRASKFVRRHRLVLAATAAVLIALLALGGRLGWEKSRAENALAVAELEQQRSERLVEFLVALFTASNPRTDRDGALSAREMLQRCATMLMTELGDRPEIRARAQREIGEILKELGDHETAAALLERAITTQKELGDVRATARSITVLASVRIGQGDYARAETLLEEAETILRPLAAGPDQDLANVLHEQGVAAAYQGRLEEAGQLVEDAIAMHRAVGGDEVDEAQMLNTLGAVRQFQGEVHDAEAIHRRALAIRLRVLGPDHLTVSETQNNLGALLLGLGESSEARELFEGALATRGKIFGETHSSMAVLWHNLGAALRDLDDLEGAETAFRKAITIYEESLGRGHSSTAGSLLRLATVLERRRDAEKAEALYRESLATFREELGERHARTGETQLYLARLLADRGAYPEALELAERAEEILTVTQGARHWHAAAAATVRVRCLAAVGGREQEEGLDQLEAHLTVLKGARDPLARRFRDDAQNLRIWSRRCWWTGSGRRSSTSRRRRG